MAEERSSTSGRHIRATQSSNSRQERKARALRRPKGARIRELRELNGLSQEALARECQKRGTPLSKRTIERVENNQPCHPPTLAAIADALGVLPPYTELIETTHYSEFPSESPSSLNPSLLLPPRPTLLLGRDEALGEIKNRVFATIGSSINKTTVVAALFGWPGVGKTTITAALAHDSEIASRFPDGVLWISLGQTTDLRSKLVFLGLLLGAPRAADAPDVRSASHFLAGFIRQKRLLLIVDDVWETSHGEACAVTGPQGAVLFSSREPGIARELVETSDQVYRLDGLPEDAALQLFEAHCPGIIQSFPRESRDLIDHLDRLPLAIRVAGSLLRVERELGWDCTDLLRELRKDALHVLNAEAPADMADFGTQTTPTVASLLKKSTDRLDNNTRRVFLALGAFAPEPGSFDLDAISAVSMTSDVRRQVRELVRRGLLDPAGDGRFRTHALLHHLARHLLLRENP